MLTYQNTQDTAKTPKPLVYLNQKVIDVSFLPGSPLQTLSNISRTGRGAH